MPNILHSRRWRRRLVLAAVLGAIVPLVYAGVRFSTKGDPGNATGPEVPNPVQPKASPFTAAEQRAVRPVLKEFITGAVARENVSRAWDVTGPSLKQDVTRAQWNRGDIPVAPYPAARKGRDTWSYVEYSYKRSVGLEVFLFPKPGSGESAMTFDVEVVKAPSGRWLVDYWLPKRSHGPPALTKAEAKKAQKEARQAAKASKRERSTEPARPEPPRASGAWWAIPVALLSLIVLLPLVITLGFWYQNRKAEREYARAAR